MTILHPVSQALLMAFGMFWEVAWSLVLGFLLSSCIQVLVSKTGMMRALGKDGLKEIALATVLGMASSSCSYASAAVSKSLFRKGAAFIPAMAFMFASTNLVIELGIVLLILMGWRFVLGEWLGGVVLIAVMTLLIRLTYPARLIEAARHGETLPHSGHAVHASEEAVLPGKTFWEKIKNPEAILRVAQHFVGEWSMLWKDLLLGFLIAGILGTVVPASVWKTLFVQGAPSIVQVPLNALLGPLVAVVSFVCSIGNVPMAAILWASGVSFGGVLSFLYADLIVLPLLDVYRRYYGWKTAAYIAIIFYVTMAFSGILMEVLFSATGLTPVSNLHTRHEITHFGFNYTFWLNLFFGLIALYLFYVNRRRPAAHGHHCCH